MALSAPSLLDSTPSSVDATSYAGASVSPAANALLVAYVYNAKAGAPDAATLSQGFSIVGSWTLIQDQINASDNGRLQVWWALAAASPGSGAVTADFGAAIQTGCIVGIVEWTGHDTSTPIPQSNEASIAAGSTSADLALPGALAAATSQCVGIIGVNITSAITPNESEIEVDEDGHGLPNRRAQIQYEVNDTNSTWTFASSAGAAIVFEVKEAAGGGPTELTAVGGIASAEAFGTPNLLRLSQPIGIASEEALGEPGLTRILQPLAISSAEAFGDANLIRWVREAGGIASGESLGQPTVGITLIFAAGGIASAESFGEPRLTRILQPLAIVSAEGFGDAAVLRAIRNAGGIASEEAVGEVRVLRVLSPEGIASAEVVSEPKLVRLIYPVSIASLEAFGITTVGDFVAPTEGTYGHVLVSDDLRFGLLVADDELYLVEVSDAERFGAILSDRPGG